MIWSNDTGISDESSPEVLLWDLARGSRGEMRALPSICTANQLVLETAFAFASDHGVPLLIEATSNQVNQQGGYTEMRPSDFVTLIHNLRHSNALGSGDVLIGGDHLGPNPWRSESPHIAMANARELVQEAVRAGYRKIHLDCSMPLGAETYGEGFSDWTIADRQADLCVVAEQAANQVSASSKPVYVIGSEVPVPGGPEDTGEPLRVTESDNVTRTIELTRRAFLERRLSDAWDRVVAVVVQPGIEFDQSNVHVYDPSKSRELVGLGQEFRGITYEAHSTDYQPFSALLQLATDGFGILKVGPELTFALREALFLLEHIERELSSLLTGEPSNLSKVVERAMLDDTRHWEKYYRGDTRERALARKYSYSDRIRYYWNKPHVRAAAGRLFSNLGQLAIPPTLVSQFFSQATDGGLAISKDVTPEWLVRKHIFRVLRRYYKASGFNVAGD